ncbi:helix-turn-helix transcriptional regulator [Actinobacillus equuli]|uniref:helix-turn-helix transcriptional regulator n=1 Tax=Actinobacillus equuli TaxID=718 RepID=UPI0024182A3E|nr:helix-turn-helix domain-containing protein [Actinobacillus equuli]MDG4952089.1 helix-turn-helix domain-containing protein [Actinobacillus equuli subsp. equuli]
MEQIQSTQPTQKQLLNVQDVRTVTGLSVTTIYKLVKNGAFPPPKKCGRSTRWRLADIQAYINS